ncbi:MAG: hypothetical protein V4447_13060 [Pseudomonadota bacterium]
MLPLRLLLAIIMMFYLPISIAGQYDWVIQKLPKNLEGNIDRAAYAVGTIGNQKYLAISTETENGSKQALVFARIRRDKTYDPFALIEYDSFPGLSLQIKNESIYIRSENAHHGTYSTTYQFKLQNDGFRLIGIEKQSMVLSESGKDIWRGESVNLLTSEAIYWVQAIKLDTPSEQSQWEKALERHRQGLPSTNAQTRTVSIKLNKRWYLKDFDLVGFSEDFLCHYFDDNLKFYNSCK